MCEAEALIKGICRERRGEERLCYIFRESRLRNKR
jgi:hypothetical protein